MPARDTIFYSKPYYRYGFNGQEKSNELNKDGNLYTAEFWEYDGRINRRWNTDPVTKPYESPYSVLGDNPISIIDPNGSDTLTFIKNITIRKPVTAKSNLDGTPSKTIVPGSTTTTGDINIKAGGGPDVFYYQENVTTIDPSKGTASTVNGKLEEFNPTGSASNFYRTGGWSGIMGPQYDDRNVLAMLAPKWLLTYYAGKSSGPQKWAYQTALVNQSDLPFIASLQKITNVSYTIAGVYGVATLALRQAAVTGLESGENFFTNSRYSSKVFTQMNNTPDLYHAFPGSVDGFAAKFGRWTVETGGDGKAYEWLRLPGSWAGKNGVFEYTKDANGVINHRYFNPTP